MLDFAGNYQYVLQDEIQSFHWSISQCSTHPAVIYYKDVSNFLQEKSFAFISEDLKHDTAFVYEVMSKDCEYVKENYQHIAKVRYFSDGCAVQYKNYRNFLNLCHHYSDFDLETMEFLCNQSWKICCWWHRRDNKAINWKSWFSTTKHCHQKQFTNFAAKL